MKIAVVGPCASGKSTIVAALREQGHDAYAVSQEHSIVQALWKHLEPEFLVLLETDYEDVRQRRGGSWPRWLYEVQLERLNDARHHADVVVDTGRTSLEDCVSLIRATVEENRSH